MQDYKPYVGREVSVMTTEGTFQGTLERAGKHSLTVAVSAWFYPDGEQAQTPKGVVVIEQFAISFVQVR